MSGRFKKLLQWLVGPEDEIPGCHVVDQNLEDLKAKAALDAEYESLKALIMNGFPQKRNEVDENLRVFWSMRNEVYVE